MQLLHICDFALPGAIQSKSRIDSKPYPIGMEVVIELRTLRYFLAIADAGGVTAAATILHVAQPALSRQLQSLERELGTALFHRTRGGLTLTAAGARLVPAARELLTHAARVDLLAGALKTGHLSEIRIAAPRTTIEDVVAPFIARFTPDDPMPSVIEAPTDSVHHELASGRADVALSPASPPPELDRALVARFPILCHMPPDEAPRTKSLRIDRLDPARLLLLPQSYVQRQLFDAAAARAGLSLSSARQVSSPEVAQALSAAGWGHAIVSDESRFGLSTHPLTVDGRVLTMPLYAAWAPDHYAAAQLREFVERIARHCRDAFDT